MESKEKGFIKKDKEYFIETKNGKQISVRDIQLEVLSVMDEIQRVCVKNDIKCFLIAGSALGMCNYGGFIPWDDDMDVAVNREDWPRFIEALKKDLGKDFYFDCYEVDKRYNTISGPNMKVRKRGSYIEEVNFLLKNRCKRGDGIFVDIIVYDNVSENKFIDQFYRTLVKLAVPFILLFDNLHINPIPFKSYVTWIAKRYGKKFPNSKLISQVISYPWEPISKEPIFLKEDVYPLKKYKFEGRDFYSFNNIEKVMKEWYSPNCLKKWNGKEYEETLPVEKRAPKHIKEVNLDGEEPIK